jgi:hypothetical protein
MLHPALNGFREGSPGRGVGGVRTFAGAGIDWDFIGTGGDPLGQGAKFGGNVFNHVQSALKARKIVSTRLTEGLGIFPFLNLESHDSGNPVFAFNSSKVSALALIKARLNKVRASGKFCLRFGMPWKIRCQRSGTQDRIATPAKIMSEEKLTKADVEALYGELTELKAWTNPTPDPSVWPPVGWHVHPTAPGYLYRMETEEALREEIFGSEEKAEWLKWASNRIEEIKNTLAGYFFPKPKDEGTERKTKSGFVTMLKTGVKRKFDLAALAITVAECQAIANKKKIAINVEETVIDWKPALKLTEYRELPEAIRKQFDAALIVTPDKPTFEIVRVGEED